MRKIRPTGRLVRRPPGRPARWTADLLLLLASLVVDGRHWSTSDGPATAQTAQRRPSNRQRHGWREAKCRILGLVSNHECFVGLACRFGREMTIGASLQTRAWMPAADSRGRRPASAHSGRPSGRSVRTCRPYGPIRGSPTLGSQLRRQSPYPEKTAVRPTRHPRAAPPPASLRRPRALLPRSAAQPTNPVPSPLSSGTGRSPGPARSGVTSPGPSSSAPVPGRTGAGSHSQQ
jgi:hypothetical protein